MKLQLLLLVTLVCAVSGQSILPDVIQRVLDRTRARINQQFINFFENQRENFPVGWPDLGIPPIDPLYIEDFEANIESISTLSSINFRLNDAYLEGLGQFEIKKFDIRFLRPSVSFDFFFKELVIEGQHTTRANLVIVPVSGNGPVKMIFNDFRIKGVFEMNTINGGYLNINQMIFSAQVGSVNATLRGFGAFLDGTISSLISNSLPGLINDGSDGINDLINESFLPLANEYLNQYRLIDVLLALIR